MTKCQTILGPAVVFDMKSVEKSKVKHIDINMLRTFYANLTRNQQRVRVTTWSYHFLMTIFSAHFGGIRLALPNRVTANETLGAELLIQIVELSIKTFLLVFPSDLHSTRPPLHLSLHKSLRLYQYVPHPLLLSSCSFSWGLEPCIPGLVLGVACSQTNFAVHITRIEDPSTPAPTT